MEKKNTYLKIIPNRRILAQGLRSTIIMFILRFGSIILL